MSEGWISIHRSIEDNKMWRHEPFSRAQAWIDLLLLANHKEGEFVVRGNVVKVKRGQVGWSAKALAKRWKWSRGKVGRFLEYLENEHQIEHQKTSLTTLISVINYDKYQTTSTKTDIRRTSDGHQTDTNNNDNKENKVNTMRDSRKMSPDKLSLFEEFWNAGLQKQDKKKCLSLWSRLSAKDIDIILAHIKKYVSSKPENERQYLKRPRTYLFNRSWEDEDLPGSASSPVRKKVIV